MSELVGGVAAAETALGDSSSSAEAGALVRRAREALGLRIEVLAASLKVPVAKLEALESGQLESLSDRVFVRALAASVCRHVKLDPELVLAKLPMPAQSPWTHPKTASNTAFKQDDGHHRRPWLESLSRPVVLAVVALLVGAALITFWPQLRASGVVPAATPEATGTTVQEVAQVVPPAPVAPHEVAVVVAPVAVTPFAPSSAAVPAALAAPVLAASAPVAAVAAPELLVLRARADSWVRVIDAKNVVLLQKTLAAGETAAVAGAVPLAVTIGRADAVDVQVRGQPRDLSTVAAGAVARFAVQ